MYRRQIALRLAADVVGLDLRMETFTHRLILQKTIYLAQEMGVPFGYFYRWYLRGPYSPELTRDAFAVALDMAEGNDEWRAWRLDPESGERLENLRTFMGEYEEEPMARRLELLASVHFLVDRRQVESRDAETIVAVLSRFGKDYLVDEVKSALGDLQNNGFFANSEAPLGR